MYDGDNDNEEDDMPRLATKNPTDRLRLQGGNGRPQVETVPEEDFKEVPNKDDIVIMEDFNEEEEENNKSGNHDYSKQGIFGKFTNYGYTKHRTTTNEVAIDTNDTADTNKETETDN